MSAFFQACEFQVTNQAQESAGGTKVWALICTAVVIETMEMAYLQQRDYGESRVLWSVP